MCKYIEVELNRAHLGNKNLCGTEMQKARMYKGQDEVVEVRWRQIPCSSKGGIKDFFFI